MSKSQKSLQHKPTNIQHCKHCDAELLPHARFCSVCGTVTESVESQAMPQELEEHIELQKWRSIGKSVPAQKSAGGASPSAKVTKAAETLDDTSAKKDDVQVLDAVGAEDLDEEAEDEGSYTQPHLSAVIANIGRRQKAADIAASSATEQKSLSPAGQASDAYRSDVEDYDTMLLRSYAPVPKPLTHEIPTESLVALKAAPVEKQPTSAVSPLAEVLDMSQTQRLPAMGRVGRKVASLPVEARETQRTAAAVISADERVESARLVGAATAIWPVILIVAAMATALLVYVVPGLPLRPYVVLAFLILCPGMALIRLLRLHDVTVEWTLAIALSIVLDAIIPTIQLYAHLWSPDISLAIILGITVIAALAQFVNPRPRATKKVRTEKKIRAEKKVRMA